MDTRALLIVCLAMALKSAHASNASHMGLPNHTSTLSISVDDTLTVTEYAETLTTTSIVPQFTKTHSAPDSTTFTAFAFRPGTPIHLQWIQAAGNTFWLGGEPATYCPSAVQEEGGCPAGNYTAFSSCAMVSLVYTCSEDPS